MGLMDGSGKNEYEIVSGLARGSKDIAKLLNLPGIILCQTSREAGKDGEKEITLSAGRGSGAIEEAADFALGLFQVEIESYMIGYESDYQLICKILKNRKGKKGSRWILDLDPDNFRIGSKAEKWEPKKKNKKTWQDNV